MMNLVGICLVVSTLLAAEVWTPSPKDDVIVKDGHRVVVVEYDQDGRPNTKVSISPTTKHGQDDGSKGVFDNVKERTTETVSVLPNTGQGITKTEIAREDGAREHHTPQGELICDAFGRCTHRIAATVGKAKDRISRLANEAHEAGEEVKDSMAKKARETGEKVSEKTREIGHTASEKVRDAGEAAAWKAHGLKEAAVEAAARKAEEAKETVARKAQQAKEKSMDKAQEVKDKAAHEAHEAKETVADQAHEVRDTVAHKAQEAKHMVADKAQEEKDMVAHKAQQAKDRTAHKAQKMWEGGKRRMRGAAAAAGAAVPSTKKTGSIMGVMGVATAYGTCVWVTFLSSYVLATVLGRQQFGIVQSKVYPVYFKAMSVSILAGLVGHVLRRRKRLLSDAAEMWQAFNLLASLFMVETNARFLEPRATKAMFERMKAEKEEGRGRDSSVPDPGTGGGQAAPESPEQDEVRQRMTKLGDRLRRLNSYSSWLNILTLMSLTWHLVYLAQRLGVSC